MLTAIEIATGIALVVFSISQIRWHIPTNSTKWYDSDSHGPPLIPRRESDRREFEKARVMFFVMVAILGIYLVIVGVSHLYGSE